MYVGRKHMTTTTTRALRDYRCASCGEGAYALVVGVGQGQGNSAFFLDESGARQRADASAKRSADDNVQLTLSLARCPVCGRRDERAHRAIRSKTAAAAFGVLGAMVVLGFLLEVLDRGRSHMGLWICVPIGLVSACAFYSLQRWKWVTADQRVSFFSEEALLAAAADKDV